MIKFISRGVYHFLICSLVLSAIGISAIRLFLPFVENYKSIIESRFYQISSIAIDIGSIRANMRGFSPELVLSDIHVLKHGDLTESNAIQLKQIRLGFDLLGFLMTGEAIRASRLTLVGLDITTIRDESGRFFIQGLPDEESAKPYWLLKGTRYEILQSQISFEDRLLAKPLRKFTDFNLLLRNDLKKQQHQINLISDMPDNIGQQIRISMLVEGDVSSPSDLDIVAYTESEQLDMGHLAKEFMPDSFPLTLTQGAGNFKLWWQWRNMELVSLQGEIAFKEIQLFNKVAKEQTLIKDLASWIRLEHSQQEWLIELADFSLDHSGFNRPASCKMKFKLDDKFTQFKLAFNYFDLAWLTQLPVKAFVNQNIADWLNGLQLQGFLKNAQYFADFSNQQFAINADFSKVQNQAYGNVPELSQLKGSIRGNEKAGYLFLDSHKVNLKFPDLFRQGIFVQDLQSLLQWKQDDHAWHFSSQKINLSTPDFKMQADMKFSFPKQDAAYFVDFRADINEIDDVSRLSVYYPVAYIDDLSLKWLDSAFRAGKIDRLQWLYYGNPDNHPFKQNEGVFQVYYQVDDLQLHYDSEWPDLFKGKAQVKYLNDALSVNVVEGYLSEIETRQIKVEIPSIEESEHILVSANLNTTFLNTLDFFLSSPLSESAQAILDAITPSGPAELAVNLKIPYSENVELDYEIIANFDQSGFIVNAIDLPVNEVSGSLSFADEGIFSNELRGSAMGFPLMMGITGDDHDSRFTIKGKTSVAALKKQFSFFDHFLTKSGYIDGSSQFEIFLKIPNDDQDSYLTIHSDLLGMKLGLPEYLAKTEHDTATLAIKMELADERLMPLFFNYKKQLSAAMMINKEENEIDSAQFFYGTQEHFPEFDQTKHGLHLNAIQNSMNLKQWSALFQLWRQEGEIDSGPELKSINLNVKQILWEEKNYGELGLAMKQVRNEWQGMLSSYAMTGGFVLPEDDVVRFDLEYLNLSNLLDFYHLAQGQNQVGFPMFFLQSEELFWKGHDLGSVEINVEKQADGILFDGLHHLTGPQGGLSSFSWKMKDIGEQTLVDAELLAVDFGSLMKKLGFANDFEETQAKVNLSGYWPGNPATFSLNSLDADVKLALEGGRISSIEPGFGRILGVIAVEQWVKRLSLDFSDIFKKGLSFNHITADFRISEGLAKTNNLIVDAVPALIKITGIADLRNETLNHHVVVIPKSSDAVPIAGEIVGRIAKTITKVITPDYSEGYFFGSKYQITGYWDDMQVIPLPDEDGLIKKTLMGLTDFSWVKSVVE